MSKEKHGICWQLFKANNPFPFLLCSCKGKITSLRERCSCFKKLPVGATWASVHSETFVFPLNTTYCTYYNETYKMWIVPNSARCLNINFLPQLWRNWQFLLETVFRWPCQRMKWNWMHMSYLHRLKVEAEQSNSEFGSPCEFVW